jgi:hypothetical protein
VNPVNSSRKIGAGTALRTASSVGAPQGGLRRIQVADIQDELQETQIQMHNPLYVKTMNDQFFAMIGFEGPALNIAIYFPNKESLVAALKAAINQLEGE